MLARTMPEGVGRNRDYLSVSSHAIDAELADLAAKRHGIVTTRELLALGLDEAAIRYRVKVGRLHRQHRGVYSVGRRATTPLERASAAVLAGGPGAVLSHASSMTLWGYWKRWDQPFEITVRGDRRIPGITAHRSSTLHRRDVRAHLGIRTTSPARTIFDIAPRLTDKSLKRTVNSALHSEWLHESQLAELIARLAHLPPAHRLAPLLGLAGTPPRSGWEDGFPAFCREHGLPAPVMGVPMFGYVVDALFVAERVIVELDSREFHMGLIPFEGDRERDAEMLANRFATVRITWERIEERPQREAARLHRILANQRTLHAPRAA